MKASSKIAIGVALLAVVTAVVVFLFVRDTGDEPAGIVADVPVATSEVTEGLAKPLSFTATVIVVVNGGCDGGAFSDVRVGGQVQVVNQKNKVLSTGTLARVAGDSCSFSASVGNIPTGETTYGAKVGTANRAVTWKSADEARQGWQLTLGN
jgi:hypothetical protein